MNYYVIYKGKTVVEFLSEKRFFITEALIIKNELQKELGCPLVMLLEEFNGSWKGRVLDSPEW